MNHFLLASEHLSDLHEVFTVDVPRLLLSSDRCTRDPFQVNLVPSLVLESSESFVIGGDPLFCLIVRANVAIGMHDEDLVVFLVLDHSAFGGYHSSLCTAVLPLLHEVSIREANNSQAVGETDTRLSA